MGIFIDFIEIFIFIYVITFNPRNNSWRKELFLTPFYKEVT